MFAHLRLQIFIKSISKWEGKWTISHSNKHKSVLLICLLYGIRINLTKFYSILSWGHPPGSFCSKYLFCLIVMTYSNIWDRQQNIRLHFGVCIALISRALALIPNCKCVEWCAVERMLLFSIFIRLVIK
jgi:hypothetical protein